MTASLAWEIISGGLRADSLVYSPSDGKLYLFYTASATGLTQAVVGVASSTDLGLTWTKNASPILTPSGTEITCSQCAVMLEGTTLHAVYAYRTASAHLPAYRYASASTSDWLTWTKGGVDVYSDPESPTRYHEFHQLFKVGSTYILCYESGTSLTPYDIRLATSSSPSTTFTRSTNNPFLVKSETVGAFDEFHVATAQVIVVNGYYYIFYCGALDHDQPFATNHWQMGVASLGA